MNKKKSTVYLPGIEGKPTNPDNGKFYTLGELQKIVEGYIECLSLNNNMTMVVIWTY
jgi:hypothetical protein